MITAEVIAERLGARLLTVPGFYPQVQQPVAVNEALARLWEQGDAGCGNLVDEVRGPAGVR